MTFDNLKDTSPIRKDETIKSIRQNPKVREDFLCIAILEEFIRDPNSNIANLFVFVPEYKSVFRNLIQSDEKDWNTLISNITFDGGKFSEFFIPLYESDLYGVGFLEDVEKEETILNIVEHKEGNILHLSRPLESVLEKYVSNDCENKGITTPNDIVLFDQLRHDERIYRIIKYRLFNHIVELRKNLREKLIQNVGELREKIQNQVTQTVVEKDRK